jgi:hypothetical protein
MYDIKQEIEVHTEIDEVRGGANLDRYRRLGFLE